MSAKRFRQLSGMKPAEFDFISRSLGKTPEVAEKLGVTAATLSRYRTGVVPIPVTVATLVTILHEREGNNQDAAS